ncbi:response regulator receiver domain protein [Leptolyngbya boryana NIES-2135]|jgi:chemotaxis family two-component system sensor histidine kinase/response regulator PixL|uniref:histidine kinase n=1 Tax=Leptolyngbya boryana NIES-2135 TaxID=1973484 RepID=A0A1Z4JI30_LEPBY|nr:MULTISPECIES: hybrid sensor histidine kinase/response regulator [Leptolyngbya]BAY56386.1 response regulator receiver domain protein [Leptolyngbya boryana NIES-2135]MBD2366492.1 hybrid sensor histidine kinase/response regulator [Leptolyngbya sp. FACHB-161]MBD2372671.1 hybrid sensor histidine kinase/response regulator [Leptolyngbya sp. FACHB-238]MBD2397094.1 hybrid sensor histidine kinase/response regulator [Leptolyngbya sp. FACHB-239]MBD2403618.1 hybrid sensor histidine kinase/response regul
MISDAKLREQTYSYFLAEAEDLLQTIEQNLLSLRKERSAAKVHELMRAAHTLKGAAASVQFDSMKSMAHAFEDVFKAFYKPEVEIDAELEALLYEGYDCLRLPLTTVVSGVKSQDAEVLDRSEIIFSKIRNKLGKHFDPGAALPTSADLGFDIAQSLFETGVTERLEQLAIAISQNDDDTIALTLHTQSEVFLGLAESLNLPGFGEIAHTALKAMKQKPHQVRDIAQAALADFRQGQIAVLSGDRVSGGKVSSTLQSFVESNSIQNSQQLSHRAWRKIKNFFQRSRNELSEPQVAESFDEPKAVFSVDPEIEALADQFEAWQTELPEAKADLGFELWDTPITETEIEPPSEPLHLKESAQNVSQKPAQDTVRVKLTHLESLNFITSELLIHQNQQLLQDERLQMMLAELLHQVEQHQRALAQLREWSLLAPERFSRRSGSLVVENDLKQNFDTLELDRYNDLHVLLQTLVEQAERIDESTEAIDFLARESRLSRSKQGRLLTNLRDDLMNVRMIAIGTVLNRFPPVVEQLCETYGKKVHLKLTGTQVMIDKALADKLYDPLLHLVRNAFDHGIERDAIRQQQGKGIGEIEIRAYQKGNRTLIEVSDNGRGLDLEQICQRGFEQHRLSSNQIDQISNPDLLDLLFEPGFSTAEQVTELSGRGVGLDVVRSQIRAMKGEITVDSVPTQGTTFSLRLPLTLMSTRLLICQAGSATYGFPSDDVERIVTLDAAEIDQIGNQRTLRWRYEGEEHTITIHSLGQLVTYTNWLFGMQAQSPETFGAAPTLTTSILIIRRQKHWIGLEVDRVLGEQELVLRPMGSTIAAPRYVYGCSVLGDGRSLLAIDAVTLVEQNQGKLSAPVAISPPAQKETSLKSVLVIDDSITVRQALAMTLEDAGFQVVQAQDGLDAIAQLQCHPEIQLITCDVEMPRLNGFEFLMRYEQESQFPHVPVVMLTSRSNEKHQQLAKQLGAAAYLTKPFDSDQLVQLVHQLMAGKVVR